MIVHPVPPYNKRKEMEPLHVGGGGGNGRVSKSWRSLEPPLPPISMNVHRVNDIDPEWIYSRTLGLLPIRPFILLPDHSHPDEPYNYIALPFIRYSRIMNQRI